MLSEITLNAIKSVVGEYNNAEGESVSEFEIISIMESFYKHIYDSIESIEDGLCNNLTEFLYFVANVPNHRFKCVCIRALEHSFNGKGFPFYTGNFLERVAAYKNEVSNNTIWKNPDRL